MNNQLFALQKKMDTFLDEHGIGTAVIVFKDPDRDLTSTMRRGDLLWCIGALEGMKQTLVESWMESDLTEEV